VGRLVVFRTAIPLVRVTGVPTVVPLLRNWTTPVGTGLVPTAGTTVAVSATDCPATGAVGDAETVVTEPLLTVAVSCEDMLVVKLAPEVGGS
jgi:hypothetical protein